MDLTKEEIDELKQVKQVFKLHNTKNCSLSIVVWHGSPCHKDFLILLNVARLRKFVLF